MKLNILKAALEYYAMSADCSNEDRQEVFAAITSCAQVQERFTYSDTYKNECYVLSADAMAGLLNIATYDWYGRRQKIYGNGEHRLPFDHYAAECRKYIPDLTNEQLELGYDYIGDLWHDNEALEQHNDDGTFKHNN